MLHKHDQISHKCASVGDPLPIYFNLGSGHMGSKMVNFHVTQQIRLIHINLRPSTYPSKCVTYFQNIQNATAPTDDYKVTSCMHVSR